MTLPNFLIIGAAKSGTTSLYHYLRQHPDVFLPDWKEPCYFLNDLNTAITDMGLYRALFANSGGAKAVGEASPGYLYESEAPKRIMDTLGQVKLIAVLRNPVDRAYSMWNWHRYRYGFEDLSFEEALENEHRRMSDPEFRKKCKGWHRYHYYFDCGLYYKHLKRYADVFGLKNIKVVLFEDLKTAPLEVCREIFEFLGVDPSFVPEIKRHNVAAAPKSPVLEKFLIWARYNRVVHIAYSLMPNSAKMALYKIVEFIKERNKKPRRAKPLDPALRAELMKRYMPDIRELENLLGRNLSIWYGGAAG